MPADLEQQLEQGGVSPDLIDAVIAIIDDSLTPKVDPEGSDEVYANAYLYATSTISQPFRLTVGLALHSMDRDSSQSDESGFPSELFNAQGRDNVASS